MAGIMDNIPMRGDPIASRRLKEAGIGAPETRMTLQVPGMDPVSFSTEDLRKVTEAMKDKPKRERKAKRPEAGQPLDSTTQQKLRQGVAKIERLEQEKKETADEIAAVYAELKAIGFDTKAVRKCIRLRKIEKAERDEAQLTLDLYMEALEE